MKKILFLCMMIAGFMAIDVPAVQAQLSPTRVAFVSRDTSTNADTVVVTFTGISSRIKAFQASVAKLSGTVGGKVYLQGTIDGSQWVNIDSLSNSNVANNTKVFPITATTYYSYRAYYISSGTQSSVLTFSYLRRQDE